MNLVVVVLVAASTVLGDDNEWPQWGNATIPCSYSNEMIEMNCSGLELTSAAIFTDLFASTRIPIKILTFSDNHITKLHANTFQSQHQLESLNFSHNGLISIDKNAFKRLDALTVLDLSTNNLTHLPSNVFRNLRKLEYLNLNYNQIDTIAKDTFIGLEHLEELDLRNNRITKLTSRVFAEMNQLLRLYLQYNQIKDIENFTFDGLQRLHELNMSYNAITTLPTCLFRNSQQLCHNTEDQTRKYTFDGPRNLKIIGLKYNRLTKLTTRLFDGLYNLSELGMPHNKIAVIEDESFYGLYALYNLSIAENEITDIQNGMFRGMEQLKKLNMTFNPIGAVEAGALKVLNLHCLCASHQRFCCLVGSTTQCLAPKFQFSDCRNLTENSMIRIFVWILAIIAVLNNLYVIFIRSLHRNDTNRVNSFLVQNLALSDLFMGVYLLIIMYAELIFAENYGEHDYEWRNSASCYFAGFLSTFSSELTVFILTVIALDRLFVITFPLRCQQRGIERISYFISLCWILALIIAAIPLPIFNIKYFEQFYSRSGVCLALHLTPESAPGWQYSIFVFIALNAIAFLIIAISYIFMYRIVRESGKNVDATNRTSNTTMATRMTLVVSANAACWTPIIILGLYSIAGYPITDNVYAWVAQFVLPLNAALNPILYTFSSPQMISLFCIPFRAIYSSLSSSRKTEFTITEAVYLRRNSEPAQYSLPNQQPVFKIDRSTFQQHVSSMD